MLARARAIAAAVVGFTILAALVALATGAAPAAADDRVRTGGVPAVGRVRPLGPGPTVSLAMLSGYGFTEDVLNDGRHHHRAAGALSLALRPIAWLELGGQLAGRYDRHGGGDDGLIGDPRLWATAGRALGGGSHLGLQLGLWLPGADAPSVELDAATVDGSLVYTYAPGATALTVRAGYRLDNSAASIDAHLLSPADRLALGLADTDTALGGLGVVHRRGPWQLVAEVSGELLIDTSDRSASPWRVGVGARRDLGPSFTLEALVEVTGSARPTALPHMGELVPIEPLIAVGLGLSWQPAPARPRSVRDDRVVVDVKPPPPPAAPTTGVLRGRIVDEQGAPLPGAEITAGATTVETDDDGRFVLPDLGAGTVAVAIDRPGYERAERTVAVTAGGDLAIDVALARTKLPSQIRGLVRGFDGKGLAAKIRIEPLGVEVTAGADGKFSVDAPPGSYTLVIEHDGHDTQRRTVKLEPDEVESLNVELQRQKRRP